VHALLVLTGRRDPGVLLSGVTVVGELALQRELVRLGARLDPAHVERALVALDEACPPAGRPWAPLDRRRPTARPRGSPALGAVPLLTVDEVLAGAREAVERGPIESWMVWLHPSQVQLVTRPYSGPARIRGPAGTGKTVVALHRARHLARRSGARVLVTSFVGTLPVVHEALFGRLAPELARAVEFRGLHSWAVGLLRSRGHEVDVAGKHVFDAVWDDTGRRGPLAASPLPPGYWRDEIGAVIKGRGLTELDDYLALDRVGRRTPLREDQRRAVWTLYLEYEQRLRRAGQCDWDDVLVRALDSVRRRPLVPPYTAVIVDEVQDLTCTGVRLLHALVADAPDGLLLVGDGQQSVYPGGFTLAEAGVNVAGRSTVLTRNYRNAENVLRHALDVVSADRFDDLDPEPEPGAREVDVDRPGGDVATVRSRDQRSQQAALLHALRWTRDHGTSTGDMAVLVPDNAAARRWVAALDTADVPAALLTEYAGHTGPSVKVGTYQRAKGLEFCCVFLPDVDRAVPPQAPEETDDAYRDRAELQRRRLFVAMTRARDRLWLGHVG
jgi:superfamily I DNA/RNA helicase